MSVQPSVETFFGKRKRLVTDDVYKPKIFKASQTNTNITTSQPLISDFFEAKPAQNEIQKVKRDNIKSTRVTVLQKTKKHKEKPKIQTKIPESINKGQEKQPSLTDESPVKFQLLGSLSPAKKLAQKNKLCKNEYNDLVVATAVSFVYFKCFISKITKFFSFYFGFNRVIMTKI